MDIDKDLDKMIAADLEDWRERKHRAVFSAEGGDERETVGSLFVDGKPIRPGFSVACHWVTLTEAEHVAERLGVSLQLA